ncbi:hypothetical protein [Cellulomonas sp. P24]|uniref:hypothetical protein n=1 Tax=Cellulomonas sp. P24 TaxID=2885206 RepID=UPI00216B5A84|nr:hypothetical protein [Cellulomonas sp. P24]MCR6494762.1 hypothetical protein [Cellulomonas sp. P24]
MNESNTVDPTTTWMQIVALLTAASDGPQTRGAVDAELHSLALGAQIVASRAVALLPIDADGDLEDVLLDVAASSTLVDLIRAARRAARTHPAAAFPAGGAAVIAELDVLVAEAEALS